MRIFMNDLGRTQPITQKAAYKVRMISGKLTREKWVKTSVLPGDVVKDSDGRVFRVQLADKVEAPPFGLSTLEKL